MNILLAGATGLVGRQVLDLALANPSVASVVAPTRRPLPKHPKLLNPQVDYERLPQDVPWWRVDAVICTLGTTMRSAGSEAAFRRVDHDYPLDVARLARKHGASTFVLNSAMGASPGSRFFYNRVKGELERDLADLGFRSLTFVRPGLIGGQRDEFRLGERMAQLVLGVLRPVLTSRWRDNPADRIAFKLIEAAIESSPGAHIVTSDQMT